MEEIPIESTIKIENTIKTISISYNKNIFNVEFKNEIESLSLTASCQKNLFSDIYKGKFSLNDIKKVGLFHNYESNDECLSEIFDGLNSNPTITIKDEFNIIITVPLHTKKYPEIKFTLKKIEKNESQKYEELVNILLELKNDRDEKDKEIKELKNKVENLEKLLNIQKENKQEITDNFDGTKIEIFNIGKNEYLDFFPEKSQCKENLYGIVFSVAVECDEKDINEVVELFNKYKEDIKTLFDLGNNFDLCIKNDKNKLIVDSLIYIDIEKIKNNDLMHEINGIMGKNNLFSFMANGIKVILKTKLNLVDICEIKEEEKINNLIYNSKLDFKGDILTCKIFISILIFFCKFFIYNGENNEMDKQINDLIYDIFLSVINGNLNYSLVNKEILENLDKVKRKIFSLIKSIAIRSVGKFNDPKYRIFQKVNFNKIKIGVFGSPKFNVGFLGVNFESPKNNEFIDKVLNGKIIFETEEVEVIEEIEKEIEDNYIID